MTATAFFVDLPNFYSHLLKSGIEEPRALRDYFLYWLDFDLLAKALTGSFSGIWVFYSGGRLGPSNERIEGQYLKRYINRINALQGVTARDVNIPGEQREPVTFQCEKCGQENVAEWKSEKGIDASLTVHLFDTMDSWDVAYLLSGDADFVPAVASLRRRGKIVIGAGFSDVSSALVRECYDYIVLCDAFLKEDVAAYTVFKQGGIAERWLTDEVRCRPGYSPTPEESIRFMVEWQSYPGSPPSEYYSIFLVASDQITRGPIDISVRHQQIKEFQGKFQNQVSIPKEGNYKFAFGKLVGEGVKRRLQTFVSSIEGLQDKKGRLGPLYVVEYTYNQDENKYVPLVD
jgi:uncharacterized LabA/DUF88 family protein